MRRPISSSTSRISLLSMCRVRRRCQENLQNVGQRQDDDDGRGDGDDGNDNDDGGDGHGDNDDGGDD